MKRNLLFINVLLLFACSFIGLVFYSNNNSIDGMLIVTNHEVFRPALGIMLIQTFVLLALSIALGRLPRKSDSRIDCVMIEFLLYAVSIAVVIILKDNDSAFMQLYKQFILWGLVGYLGFLGLTITLKFIVTLLFKKDISRKNNPKLVSQLSQMSTIILVLGGLLGLFIRAYYLSIANDSNSVSVWTDYFYKASNSEYIILACYSVLVLACHELVSVKTKKLVGPVIVWFFACLIAIACQLVLVTFADKIPGIGNDYKQDEMICAVCAGGYGLLLLVLAACYALRPFAQYVFNLGNKAENEDYATREDFVVLSEALAMSNLKKVVVDNKAEEVKEEPQEEVVEETKEEQVIEEPQAEVVEEPKEEKIIESSEPIDSPHYETELVTTISRGFKSKLINAPDDLKQLYNDLLNQVNQYKRGNVRHAFSKDSIVLGRTKIAVIKISPSSKALYIFFNLNKEEYLNQTKYHLKDYSEKKSYEATPLRLRVKSERSQRYAKELLDAAFLLNDAEPYKKEREAVDYLSELKPQTEEEMIENGLIKKKVVEETFLVEPVYEDVEVKDEAEELDEEDDSLDDEE